MNYSRVLKSSLLAMLCYLPALLHAQWFVDTGVEYQYNDNLGRSAKLEVSDSAISASALLGYHWQTGDFTGLSLTASAQKTMWQSYSGLSSLDMGLGMNLSHKFGIGDKVPVFNVSVGLNQQNYHNGLRDNLAITSNVALRKRFGDRWLLSLGAGHEHVNGDNEIAQPPPGFNWGTKSGEVWDYSAWNLDLGAEFELNEFSWLSGSYNYRHGDIISTGIIYTGNAGTLACTWEPVFGPSAVAYRLAGRTRTLNLDYNRAVFDNATWYSGIEYVHATALTGIEYNTGIFRTGLLFSF